MQKNQAAEPAQHEPAKSLADWRVSAIMSRPAVAVRRDDTMADALRAFALSGLHHLVVVDGGGRCVGILGDRAVAAAWAYDSMTFSTLRLGTVMDVNQPMLAADAKVSDAARRMRRCGADAVAVVDADGSPVGVLTAGDLIALLAKPN